MYSLKLFVVTLFIAMLANNVALASGTFGGGSGSFGSSTRTPKKVDHNYEIGKAIYTGRQAGAPKLKYCVAVEGERLPLKRSSLKTYKRGSYQDFTDNLFLCDEPEKRVSQALSSDEMLYVLYYLNKRYRLYLG